MNHYEQAYLFVESFYFALPNNGSFNKGLMNCKMRYNEAKKCASIAINKMISELESIEKREFWDKVKNELEKL